MTFNLNSKYYVVTLRRVRPRSSQGQPMNVSRTTNSQLLPQRTSLLILQGLQYVDIGIYHAYIITQVVIKSVAGSRV